MPNDELEELYRQWGSAVRERRKQLALTQSELADAAGTTKAHVSNIEVGRTSVGDELRQRLARALGRRPADLFPYPEDLAEVTAAEVPA